jgi:hypothetical protein
LIESTDECRDKEAEPDMCEHSDHPALEAEPSCIPVLFTGLPHFDEIIVVRPAFKLVIQLVVAFVTLRITDSHIGTVIGYQPALSEIAMLRGYCEANLYEAGR